MISLSAGARLRKLYCPQIPHMVASRLMWKIERRSSGIPFLRLHAPAEFLIEPFDHVRGAQRLPLRLREGEEGQQLRAALVQATHNAGTALRPLAFEGRVRRAARVGGRRIDDAMKVLAELVERVLGRLALEVAQLVDRAALHGRRWPRPAQGQAQARIAVEDRQRSEEHTSELQSPCNLVCRLLLEKKKKKQRISLM